MFGLTDWLRDKIDDWRWGKVPQHEIDLAEKRMREIADYKEGEGWVLKPGVKLVSADEDIAEWRKDPEFAKRVDAKYAKLKQEIKANDARIARRKALVKRVRAVWMSITRGMRHEVL